MSPNTLVKWLVGLCSLGVGACSLLFPRILPASCSTDGVLGCAGDDLQVCRDGFVINEACLGGACNPDGELSSCAAPVLCVNTDPVDISGPLACDTASSNTGRKAAIDLGGSLYAAMSCGGAVHVTTSDDCGQSFGPAIDTKAKNILEFAIEGGPAGVLFLAAIDDSQNLLFSRSLDHGLTWEPPQLLFSGLDANVLNALSVVSLDRSVLIAIKLGGEAHILRNESLGVGAFELIETFQPAVFLDLLLDNDSGALYVGSDDPSFHVSESLDNGASFGGVFNPPGQTFESDWAIGGRALYVTGRNNTSLTKISLDDPSSSFVIDGLPDSSVEFSRAINADPAGNVYIATQLDAGVLQLDRLEANTDTFDAPLFISDFGAFPGVKALPTSDGAFLVYTINSKVFATVQVF